MEALLTSTVDRSPIGGVGLPIGRETLQGPLMQDIPPTEKPYRLAQLQFDVVEDFLRDNLKKMTMSAPKAHF